MDPGNKSKITERRKEQSLTPEEKEITRSLENLKFLRIRDLIFIVLIWRKLKTASPVEFSLEPTEEELKKFKETIKKAGLFVPDNPVIDTKHYKSGGKKIYFVASNKKDLDLISKLWFGDHVKDPKVYKEVGRMSGFPDTAIETYDKFTRLPDPERRKVGNELTLSPEEKKKLFSGDTYYFSLFFYMSRDHWQTESETIKKWAEEIRRLTPGLYKAYIDDFKKREERN